MDEIRTDVDRLIHALQTAPGRHLSVSQLERELNLTRAQVRKWVSILESEEHVKVRYSFNDVHVTWVGSLPGQPAPQPMDLPASGAPARLVLARPDVVSAQTPSAPTPVAASNPAMPAIPRPFDSSEPSAASASKPEAPSPVKPAAQSGGSYYDLGQSHLSGRRLNATEPAISNPDVTELAREAEERYHIELQNRETMREQKRSGRPELNESVKEADRALAEELLEAEPAPVARAKGKQPEMDVAISKLASLKPAPKAAPTAPFSPIYSVSRTSELVSTLPMVGTGEKVKLTRYPTTHIELAEPVSFAPSVQMPPMPEMDPEAMRFNQKLESAMNRIKAKGEQLDALKEKKKQLLREVYRPLERKMDYGAQAIADALLKYENRLLKLRERASQLPQEVADLDERQAKMAQVAAEMQRVYDETAHLLQDSLGSILESRERASSQLQVVKEGIGTQEQNVGQMTGVLAQLSSAQAEVEARMAEAANALEEEQAHLNQAQEMLSQLSSTKAHLEGQVQTAVGELKSQKRTLQDMDAHLSRIDQVKNWVETNRSEYDSRMKQLADYIHNSDEEYAYLRESVESGFVRRHLKDLRALSESYEFELAQANQLEENVEQQITQAKTEMASLIAQAKRISYLQEMQLEEGEGERKAKAAVALGRGAMFGALEAKEKERTRIRGLIRDVIDGKSEASAPRPAMRLSAARPSKPAVRRAAKSKSRKK